jgi:nicotinamide-nucleotide amidase
MRAILLTIGDEILIGQILNSNAQWMSDELTGLGVQVTQHITVGDHEAEIVQALDSVVPKADFLIVGGGLGPTHDDITMKVLSHYFETPLEYDADWLAQLEAFFKSRNRPMTENNKKQAYLLKGATRIDNDCGTAAGQHFTADGTQIFVVPGVPHEMKSMMKRYILPFIATKNPSERILKQTLLTTGIGESALATRCEPFVQKVKARSDLTLAFLPSTTQVKLRLQMKSADANARKEFDALISELIEYCGKDFFGTDPTSIEQIIFDRLKQNHETLALAESCTGGYISHRLTQIPGISAVLKGSMVVYQTELKTKEVGISEAFLEKNGAVSEASVRAMAESIRQKWNSTYGLATTGYLGPTGGDERAPLGTVWIALSSKTRTESSEFHFEANRERAKERATQAALDLLRRTLS